MTHYSVDFSQLGHHGLRAFCAEVIVGGVAVGMISLLALHFLPTKVSAKNSSVYEYGYSKFFYVYGLQTTSFGIASAAASIGLHLFPQIPTYYWFCFAVFSIIEIFSGWLPRDKPDAPAIFSTRFRIIVLVYPPIFSLILLILPNELARLSGSQHLLYLSQNIGLLTWIAIFLALGLQAKNYHQQNYKIDWFGIYERFLLILLIPNALLLAAFVINK